MNREEAVKQIEQIQDVIHSTSKFAMSGNLCIAYGVAIFLIPTIEKLTNFFTFGTGRAEPGISTGSISRGLVHAAFYMIFFSLIRFAVEKWSGDGARNQTHPLLREAMSYHRPFVIAVGACVVFMMNAGLDVFIYPLVLLFFGVLFNIYGRLASSPVRILGWVTIAAGLIFGLAAKNQDHGLWIWANTYLAVAILSIGIGLRLGGANE